MDLTGVARRVSHQVEGITCIVDGDTITFVGPAGMLRVGPDLEFPDTALVWAGSEGVGVDGCDADDLAPLVETIRRWVR